MKEGDRDSESDGNSGQQSGIGAIATRKIPYIYRSSQPWQLPPSVGRWGLCLQQGTPFFASTFQKSVIFNKLAKMTVENWCKTPIFAIGFQPIAARKMATYDNSCRIATRNAPFFERTPTLHFGVKEVITLFDIIQE